MSNVQDKWTGSIDITPVSTRFVNSEEFIRISSVVMRLMPVEKMLAKFYEKFKARVEVTKRLDGTI